jgi:hypothetical protein
MITKNDQSKLGSLLSIIGDYIFKTNVSDIHTMSSGYLVYDKKIELWMYKDEEGVIHYINSDGVHIHNNLVGRELVDCHPITSITGLDSTITYLLDQIPFDGNRVVTREGIPNINVGGTTVHEFLENYFFPFLNLSITLNSGDVYEVGSSENIQYIGSVTLNSEDASSSGRVEQITPVGTVLYSFGVALDYDISIPTGVITSPTIFTSVTKAIGLPSAVEISSSVKSSYFIHPYLYGVSPDDLSPGGTDPYTQLTKLVQRTGTKMVELTGLGFIYFVFPATYADLTSILDHNGFEQRFAFEKTIANITSVGRTSNYTVSYKIYKSKNITHPSAWDYTFIH